MQAAWQKSWNQTQSLLQNLRFRERGPLKSWRPETMAEAIHAVLKEGLSLSQVRIRPLRPRPLLLTLARPLLHEVLGDGLCNGTITTVTDYDYLLSLFTSTFCFHYSLRPLETATTYTDTRMTSSAFEIRRDDLGNGTTTSDADYDHFLSLITTTISNDTLTTYSAFEVL